MEKYKKIKLVGRGAFGTVYLCDRISDGYHLIIKEIPVEQMSKDDRQSALNEAKVLAMLDHPNIIAYHENFLQNKMMLIVMELAEGGTLYDCLEQRDGRLLSEEEVLHYFSQLVLALQYVHSRSILHRDLKSQNILLNKDKTVLKIGDFGISKILTSKSRAETVVGTPYYISPELCEGKPYNQKSDIWALGCILYELLMLKRPFNSDNLPALIMKIMKGSFNPISDHYSRNMRQLVMNMLHLDPNKRPTACQILAQPYIIGTLYKMYMTIGCLPTVARQGCLSTSTRGETSADASESRIDPNSVGVSCYLQGKCQVMYFCQKSPEPLILPLPSNSCIICCISLGSSQLVGVTKTGHMVIWKESSENFEFTVLEDESVCSIISISSGDGFTICLSESGVVSSLGCISSSNCELASSTFKPCMIESLFGFNIISIACSSKHALAVSEDNDVFAWGFGDKGCLGLGKAEFHPLPQIVEIVEKPKVVKVFCGVDCSFAITEEKILLACGSNRHNKLAMDGEEGLHIEETRVFSPVRSDPLPQSRVEMVASGISHTAVLLEDGKVYTTGSNRDGQLGWGEKSLTHTMPGMVITLASYKVIDIASGDFFTVALTEDGSVFAWGQCPVGFEISDCFVRRINDQPFLKGKMVTCISCNGQECLIVTR